MSQKYKRMTGLEIISNFCTEILSYGIRNDLDTDGVKIWLNQKSKDALGLENFLAIECDEKNFNIPIIVDDSIVELPLDNGQFQSDIYVGNREWEIDLAQGEFWWK